MTFNKIDFSFLYLFFCQIENLRKILSKLKI